MQRHRPPTFRINRRSMLANGLVFAGLGGGASTNLFADASGYGNHGTLTNMEPPTDWVWDSTLGRWCNYFDSSTHRVLAGDWTGGITNSLSISIWANQPAATNSYNGMVSKNIDTSGSYTTWIGLSSTEKLSFSVSANGTSATQVANANVFPDALWTHVAAVYDGATLSIYENGASVAEPVAKTGNVFLANGQEWMVGIRNAAAANTSWSGHLTDPMIWARALSLSEIAALADPSNVMLSGLILPPKRRIYAAVTAAPAAFKAYWATRRQQVIGGGVI